MANNVDNYFVQPNTGTDNELSLNGTWSIGGTAVTSTAAELNQVDGLTGPALGTTAAGILFASGSHAITAGEETANSVTIATGLTSITTVIVQVVDSGNNVLTSDADVSTSSGNLIVADGSTYNTAETNVIRWIAVGA